MKWGFRGVQSGLVNKGVFLFAYVVYRLWLQIKIHSCDSLIFEDALKVFSSQFLVASELENEGGDFIRNRRLELAFLNTRSKSLASFLSFFL